MGGNRESLDFGLPAQVIRILLMFSPAHLVPFLCYLININIIIPVFRGIEAHPLNILIPFKVGFESLSQLLHTDLLVIKHKLFDGCQGIGSIYTGHHGSSISSMVSGSTIHEVFTNLNAVVGYGRIKRHREIPSYVPGSAGGLADYLHEVL